MKGYVISPDVLVILVSPDSTFDQRRDAAIELAAEAWSKGWDDCAETHLEAAAAFMPEARA